MKGIDIQDYQAGEELLQDPTDPNETVERTLMNKLAFMITLGEEALNAEGTQIDPEEFMMRRGEFLDCLNDQQIADWLGRMRQLTRCPYRRFAVKDDPEPEIEDVDEA